MAPRKESRPKSTPPRQRTRVAAYYCRVSTDSLAQLASLEQQIRAYETMITLKPDWELVGIYTDIASGLRLQHREGYGCRKIKRWLEEHGIKTATGKTEWSTSTIDRMLSSEKYVGDMLLQKTFTPDVLSGKQVRNDGQRAMWFVRNNHEAIIDREAWKRVQEMKGVPLPEYMRIAEVEMVPDVSEETSSGFEMKMC